MEKDLLDSKIVIAKRLYYSMTRQEILPLLFNDQEEDNVSILQRTEAKEGKKGFL